MATSRRKQSSPIAVLFEQPQSFDFFQAVRMLELVMQIDDQPVLEGDTQLTDDDTKNTVNKIKYLRFYTLGHSLSFPINDIALIKEESKKFIYKTYSSIEIYTNFIGLTGPNGALPDCYAELVRQRMHFHDHTLQEFLNLFNHRIITLFYKAWKKYRFSIGYADAKRGAAPIDFYRELLLCLLGKGGSSLRNRLSIPDDAFIYYIGIFTKQLRSEEGLSTLIKGYYKLPCQINQFEPLWLKLEPSDRTRLGKNENYDAFYNQLGIDALIGERVLEVNSRFKILIGPLGYTQFTRLIPNGDMFSSFCAMVRSYVGIGLSFDIQLILEAKEVPTCQLRYQTENPFCLGWNSWLGKTDRLNNADDLILTAI